MKSIILKSVFLLFFTLSSCVICREDDEVRDTRKDYCGDELQTEGFYYSYFQGNIQDVIFLYRNGICFKVVGDGKERTKPNEVKTLLTEERIEWHKKQKDLWGIFSINSNNILIERWSFAGLGWKSTVIESGTIINDTSFTITKWDDSHAGITNAHYEYFFYPYSPKPDSTNVFIK